MMVTAAVEASEETLAFQNIISRLQGKQDGAAAEDRTALYDSISNWFKENDAGKMTGSEVIEMGPFVSQFSTDIMSDDTTMVQAALQAMGFCLYQAGIIRALTKEDSSMVVKALCNCLLKTDDKSVCTRALWCLAKQNMKADVMEDEVHTILCSVEKALQTEGSAKSMTVQHESVNVIIRLQEQLPDKMGVHAARWGKLLLPHLVHSAPKIRDRAIQGTHLGLVAMVKCRADLAPSLIAELKGGLLTEMMKLFRARHELCVLKVWSYYVTILGKALHKGGSLINNLLAVIEQGFKHPQQEVKKAAYNTWRTLIDNFSLELDMLSNAKRLKLLMQPFLATSIRYESIAHAKLDTWWHLVRALGPRLPATFPVVCAPLLQCTLGTLGVRVSGEVTPIKSVSGIPPSVQGFSTPQSRAALLPATSPITPRLNLPPSLGGGATGQQTFPSVQQRGLRMLAAFMGIKLPENSDSAHIDTLPQRLLSSPSVFSKLAPTLIPFIMDALHMQDDASGYLPMQIFESLIGQVRGVVEGQSKRDSVAVFTLFMDQLTAVIGASQLPPPTVLKLLDYASQLPKKVLSSSSYHTGDAGILHGTPALFLTDLLFNQTTMLSSPEERFFTILMRLVECGMSSPATVLGFTQSVMAIMDRAAESIDNKEALWRMWSALAEPLLQHVIQTNEVNQGDSLEHDFSALTVCLLFPIQRLLPHNLSQPTVKTLLKLWSELYEAFARSASLVTIVEANQCCEDVCSKLLTQLGDSDLEKWYFQAAIGQMCQIFTQNLDLSPYSDAGAGSPAPRRKGKKRSRPEGNLASLVKLVGHVTSSCATLCKKQKSALSPSLGQTDMVHWFNTAQSLIVAMSDLCRVGPTSSLHGILEIVSKPLGDFIRYSASPNLSKKDYLTSVEDKVERLWTEWATAIQTRYSHRFDSSFLEVVAPILQATFTYQRRSVRNYTLVFWTATFGRQETLEYPDSLVPCLAEVRKHSEILLPGWTQPEDIQQKSLNLETEASQSQVMPIAAAVIPNFGGPSPQKHYGSFLRRAADAKALMVASSPVKETLDSPVRGNKALNSPVSGRRKQFASPMVVEGAKRRLPVDEDSRMEFVVISNSSSSKKRVLTEHQKEVMRTKRVSLALYNDLEQSQDTQAFKDLSQSQNQSQSQQPSPAVSEEEAKEHQTTKFDFSNKISREQSTKKAEQGKNKKKKTGKPEPKDKDENVADESQVKQRKRRVVTLCQPVTKPSSPIKDAGQLAVQEDGSHDNKADEEEVGDLNQISAASNKEKASDSCVIIEDTCPEDSPEERPPSAILIADIDETKEEIEMEKEVDFLVPDTQDANQDDTDIHNVSDDITLISSGNDLDTDAAGDMVIGESPNKDKVQDFTVLRDRVEDLEDVLPDGRFKKVVATPVIKLQKLKQEDINIYRPRVKEGASPEKKVVVLDEENDASTRVVSSPARVVSSPVSSSPTDSTSGTPRFRRYRSDEIHVRSATPKRTRRWNSVSEIAKSESKADAIKTLSEAMDDTETATERRNLKSTQKDLAELAERYELDGIAPLGDLDQSFDEGPSTTGTSDCKEQVEASPASCSEVLPLLGEELCEETTKVDSEEQEPKKRRGRPRMSEVSISVAEEVTDSVAVADTVVEARTDEGPSDVKRIDSEASVEVEDDVLCSQQELFSDSKEDSVIELPVSNREGPTENTPNDHDETLESVIASTQQEPSRKRGRPRRSRVKETSESQKENHTKKTSSEIQVKKPRRGRPKRSEVMDVAESDSVLDTESGLPEKEDLQHTKESDNQSQNTVKDDSNELAVEKETMGKVPESVGNESCEDIFGTQTDSAVIISSEKRVNQKTESSDVLDRSLGDSFCSEDDDVPLVQLKKSLESKDEEVKMIRISDVALDEHESEDSEIDFPSLTPKCRSDKVSPNIETPPRRCELPERLSERKEKHTKIKSPSGKGAEPFTVTRSGRKSRPSAKIRSAKGILKKLLRSPEGKALATDLKAKRKSTGAIQKISPKVLRSSIGKPLDKDNSQKPTEEGNQLPQNERHSSHEVQFTVSPVLESCAEDLSNYAISPKSLQTLAEKVATKVSPEVVQEIQTRSAQKLRHTSPETSPVSSSQVTRNSRGGRSGKRSKSPVSLRLKARRLCITPGPLQTRAGTRLSRVEIKKKNRRKQMGSQEEEGNEEVTINILENTEPSRKEDLKLTSNKTEIESTEVIVIKDTMSQDSHQGDVEQDTVMEASKYIMPDEETEEDKQATELESKVCEKTCPVAESQIVDDDGDVPMKDLEEVTSAQEASEVAVETDHAIEEGGKDNFVEVKETQDVTIDEPVCDKFVVVSDTVDVEATQDDEPVTMAIASVENKPERVVVEETQEAGGAVEDQSDIQSEIESKISQEQVETQIKTRAKRSSQRLTYGEDSSNPESAASTEKDARRLADLDKSEKEAEKMENLDDKLQKKTNDADESDSEGSSRDSDESDTDDEKENIVSEKEDNIVGEKGKQQPDEKDHIPSDAIPGMEGAEAAVPSAGTPVGIVSSGLDVQGDEDIINSSQSPHKFGMQEGENEELDSPSKRLNFPNLTPEADAMTSPDKPSPAAFSSETQLFQVSPIIPNKFSSAAQQGSPEGASMRPMWPNQLGSPEGSIPLMYSPNASPSSGILKHNCSSPSPSTKNRRVSFAEKVFIEPEPLRDNSSWTKEPSVKKSQDVAVPSTDPVRLPLPPSPLVTTASSRVVAKNSKYITTPSKGSPDSLRSSTSSSSSLQRLRKKSPHSSRRMKNKQMKPTFMKSSYASKVFSMAQQAGESQRSSPTQSTQGSLTQGNVTSQEESPLEVEGSQGSVYPALSDCSMPVDTVLPRLTSSMWSRGLGQLIRARNIRTIGDLSSLSPMQVKSLPIKSPKISHLKKVLSLFQAEKFPDMKENQSPDISQSTGDALSTTPPRSPSPPTTQEPETSAKNAEAPSPPPSPQHTTGTSLVKRLEALVSEFKEGALDSVPAVELFQAHGHVNNLMDAIVGALKGKCHSPSMGTDAN